MKKLVFMILVLTITMPVVGIGQTFHAIIFANTDNSSIGESVAVDFKRMELEMTTIAKSIGYTLKKYNYYGNPDNFNRDKLETALTNLSCSSNDIVFFYYSGHGGRAMNETTKFPEMCLFVNRENFKSDSQLYPLYDVYERIRKKNPRLTIVMGDLCNSIMKGFYRNDNHNSKGATILSKGTCDVYKNLFLNVKGGLIAASSEPKYTSGCYIFKEGDKWYHAGGYFTHSFLCLLQYCVGEGKNVSWESLMDGTITLTRDLTKEKKDENGDPCPQTPIYLPDVVSVQAPASGDNINVSPQAPALSNDAATNQRDNLAYSLSMVCNQSVPKINRIHNITEAKKYFAGMRACVQVVGCDNKTIVNTCSAESYLNYLSLATKMDQVVVVETQTNAAGKVTYMKVHEIHYQ